MARVGTRGAGLSKDIALSVKNKLTHLGANVSDDLARLSGKVEDAFAYADGAVSKNIGKHNARFYQSNGGNWDEASKSLDGLELGGLNKGFSKNVSDDLAGHTDEVSRGLKETAEANNVTVKEVPYGEQFTKGVNGRKELLPNIQYVTEDGYRYSTDEFGRISKVEVDELVLKKGTRNSYSQRVAGREDRVVEADTVEGLDDGGHLIGTQFNGSGDLDNLVSMNRDINRSGGAWFNMEKEWAKALKETPPKKVTVNIEPIYSGKSLRPDRFKVMYEIEGKMPEVKTILNQIGG